VNKIILASLLSFLCLPVSAQKEWSNWYYNGDNLLTFKNGYAQIVHNFINPIPPESDFFNFYYFGGGGISYSDSITGDMKFIVASRQGYGSNYDYFPADPFLRSCPDKYSYHILPFHDNSKRYYIVQFQSALADMLTQETGLQVRCPNAIGLGYSIADLNLNSGQGDFSLMNQVITGGLNGQITTVKHANGKDAWVIVHPFGTDQFQSILFTDAGIQPAVISHVGPFISGKSLNTVGVLTASHDGKLLAGFSPVTGVELLDFDNRTGNITNYRALPYKDDAGAIQFSPDNSKLYYLGYSALYQYDLNQPDVASSLTKVYGEENGTMYDMQLAPDGKIYVTKTDVLANNEYHEYTGAIECPNLPQYACNFNATALNEVAVIFPDLINDFIQEPKAPPVTKFSIGNDTSICFGNYTISAPTGWESYKWNTGETTRQITVNKAGVYYVLTGNTGFSCPSGYGYINVGDKAIKLDLGKDTLLCHGQNYVLTISSDYTNITWQNGSHTRDSIITTDNAYIITANDKNGCITGDTINVGYKYVVANFGPDTTLCNTNTLALQLIPYKAFTQGTAYLWQDGSTNDNFTVSKPGKYWGTVTYDGCNESDTINVNYVSAQNVFLGNDTTLCKGDSLLLQSNVANAKYYWNTGDTSRAISVKNTGSYSVLVSTALCSLSDTINVTFNSKPAFTLGADTSVCDKEKLVLTPGIIGDRYFWQDSSSENNFTVTAPGLYWLKLTQNNCTVSDSINVKYKSLPTINLGNDTGVCKGQTLLLKAYSMAAASYLWQDGDTTDQYVVKSPGIYSVKVTGINSCIYNDTIQIAFTDTPRFSLGADTVLCDTKMLSYNFNLNNATYEWSDGSTQNHYIINRPGIYSVKITQDGCSSTDTVRVNYKPMPVVNIGNDTTLCMGNSVTLNAFNANGNYLWQDNSTGYSYYVSGPGIYYVAVNLNNCVASDSITVAYNSGPSFSLGNDTMICITQQLILQPKVEGVVNYLWQDGSTQPQYVVKDSGLYSLRVSNECGTLSDQIKVTMYECVLNMPNAFTPNNDGLNDIFRVKYPFPVKEFNMSIYNQWGQKIYSSADIEKGWDGTYQEANAPVGVYVWTISLTDTHGKKQSAKGTVALIK